jgi:hypothetical protein
MLLISIILLCIEIPVEARVKNPGSYCAWSSLDTLARVHGIERLKHVSRDRLIKNQGYPDAGYDHVMVKELESRKVKHEIRKQWSYDRTLLNSYAATLGVSVSLMQGNPYCGGCHQIIVTHYDQWTVQFFDTNTPKKDRYTCSREWFDTWWLGNSLVIFPDEP